MSTLPAILSIGFWKEAVFWLPPLSNCGFPWQFPIQWTLWPFDMQPVPLTSIVPFATSWWFVPTTLVLAAISFRQFFVSRVRTQRNVQELLQQDIEAGLQEVNATRAELEQKQKEIDLSLQYAKHIQDAILPEDEKLNCLFPDSFIFHRAKETVSGDFYWFKRYGKKFVIACADATGHGVPGAFMSMIGSILLRDVSTMHTIDAPNRILDVLDKELHGLLRSQPNGITVNDGMDISICEIDIESSVLRTAAAMHSIFIYRNDCLERIKGDRHSIGGLNKNAFPFQFSMQTFELEPGDRIYLLSNGIQNQFGGMHGKKMKLTGLVELLESIMTLPMEEQADLLRNKFNSWKNGYEQVDDVLFIGLQI